MNRLSWTLWEGTSSSGNVDTVTRVADSPTHTTEHLITNLWCGRNTQYKLKQPPSPRHFVGTDWDPTTRAGLATCKTNHHLFISSLWEAYMNHSMAVGWKCVWVNKDEHPLLLYWNSTRTEVRISKIGTRGVQVRCLTSVKPEVKTDQSNAL